MSASAEARALYRHILREITYLPDPGARRHLNYLARRGFDSARDKQSRHQAGSFGARAPTTPGRPSPSSPSPPSSPAPSSDLLTKQLANRHKVAATSLRRLQDANTGDTRALSHVLAVAYGRRGPRRRALLERLIHISRRHVVAQRAAAGEPEDALFALPNSKLLLATEPGTAVLAPSPLAALATSQQALPISSPATHISPFRPLKRTKLTIQSHSIFQKPLSEGRVAAVSRRVLAYEVLERLLPPLPVNEWRRLRALATGAAAWPGLVPRRRPAGSAPGSLRSVLVRRAARVTGGAAATLFSDAGAVVTVNGERVRVSGADAAAAVEAELEGVALQVGARARGGSTTDGTGAGLTERAMRRAWAGVFALTPVMGWRDGPHLFRSDAAAAARAAEVSQGADRESLRREGRLPSVSDMLVGQGYSVLWGAAVLAQRRLGGKLTDVELELMKEVVE